MTGWRAVADEVARWGDAGHIVKLWWRDDDAIDVTAELDRLLAIRRDTGAPLALAVVPAKATLALAAQLADLPGIDVLQHGYAHADHAGGAGKKIELGLERPAMLVLGELGTGWLALERLFGATALPVMVPPWNRIAPSLVPTLPEIGYRGLSTFGPRMRPSPVRGLRQVNTHVDLMDWKTRRFVGAEAALGALAAALERSRSGNAEPVGVLSHHLAMDDGAWDFLRSILERTKAIPGVRMCAARELFAATI